MNHRWMVYVALLLLPACTMAQTTLKEEGESGLAHARLAAARKLASAVTAQQCLADLSSWETRDAADDSAKVESPAFWYQRLSTEELVRLSMESAACGSSLRHAHHRDSAAMMPYYGRMFDDELIGRAEAILAEHYLIHEYLLKSSE